MAHMVASLKRKIPKARQYFAENGLSKTLHVTVLQVWAYLGGAKHTNRGVRAVLWCVRMVFGILLAPFRFAMRVWRFIVNLPERMRQKMYTMFVAAHPRILAWVCMKSTAIRRLKKARAVSGAEKRSVLHVTCSFDLGGTQRQIINLCSHNRDSRFQHDAIEYFPEQNYLYRQNITLDPARYAGRSVVARILGRQVLLPSSRSLQIMQIYKLVCDFKAQKPDVVVGWGHEIAMLTFVAAAIARVPKILFCIRTFNPSYGWTTIGPLLHDAHKSIEPYLDGIICNSTMVQKDYSSWIGVPQGRVLVCPNGISPGVWSDGDMQQHRQEIRSRFNIPADALVITNIGRFSKEKGQVQLVKAYHQLINLTGRDDIYCMLCGDGPLEETVRSYGADNGLSKLVLPGRIDAVHAFLCAADIFVMPSVFEGMPNAMMEAMAHGLPCVSTNNTGALDIARDGQEALYVDVDAVGQLAEKLTLLVERPDERTRLGSNGRERLRGFSIDVMIERFNRHLETILQDAGRIKANIE